MPGLILVGSVLGLLVLSWLAGWRSVSQGILAVLAGYTAMAVPFVAGINLLFAEAVFAPDATLSFRFLLFLLFMWAVGMLGGFVTVLVGKDRPVLHAGALALFLTAFAAISFFNAPAGEPRWTRLVTQAVLVPAVIAGGVAGKALST